MFDQSPSQLVSILSPVFNRAGLVEEMISSVVTQTSPDWELILVDDGSTDGETEEIARRACEQDHRIRLFHRPPEQRKGANTCRNIALKSAKGTFVVFLDSDDLIDKDFVEGRLAEMAEAPDLDFIAWAGRMFYDEPGDDDCYWNWPTDEAPIHRFLRGEPAWQTAGGIWRRSSLIDRLVLWDERLPAAQDLDFHLNALLSGLKGRYLAVADYSIRRATSEHGSISSLWDQLSTWDALNTIMQTWGMRLRDSNVEYLPASWREDLRAFYLWFARQAGTRQGNAESEDFSALIESATHTSEALGLFTRAQTQTILYADGRNLKDELLLGLLYREPLRKLARSLPLRHVTRSDTKDIYSLRLRCQSAQLEKAQLGQPLVESSAVGECLFFLIRGCFLRAFQCGFSRLKRRILNFTQRS